MITTAIIALALLCIAMILAVRMLGTPSRQASETGLPIREFKPSDSNQRKDTLVVFLTSDVGWLGLNTDLPRALADHGYPTVAWNSLSYYLRKRTPQEASAHLSHLLTEYSEKWNLDKVALVGYSWGAGVLPFLANGLPEAQRSKLTSVGFLAYPGVADFHFQPSAWLLVLGKNAISATEEVGKMPKVPSVCIAGDGDPIRDCRSLQQFGIKRHLLTAKHSLTPKLEEVLPHLEDLLEEGLRTHQEKTLGAEFNEEGPGKIQ